MFIDLSMKHMYIGTCLHILVYITSILLRFDPCLNVLY